MRATGSSRAGRAACVAALAAFCAVGFARGTSDLALPPRIAVLPVENLTGRTLDATPIEAELRRALQLRGLALLDDEALHSLMDAHRVRYTGGLDPELAAALRAEAAVTGVLITSIERWVLNDPPVLELTTRLVTTDPRPRIAWMESAGATGEDRPGFLDLGLIHDPQTLLERSVARLAQSLADGLSGRAVRRHGVGRFRPRKEFRHPEGPLSVIPARVAVLPFTNRSPRRHGGDLVALHFVEQLAQRNEVEVVEPGIVRDVLLRVRIIPEGGIAFTQADLLKELLGADLVLTGDVLDYADGDGGTPLVDFTTQLLDGKRRSVVWSSFSHSTGSDRVWFFNQGRIYTAGGLVSAMTEATVNRLLRKPLKLPRGTGE